MFPNFLQCCPFTRVQLVPSSFREALAARLWDTAQSPGCSSLPGVAATRRPLQPLPCLQPATCIHGIPMCLTDRRIGVFLLDSKLWWLVSDLDPRFAFVADKVSREAVSPDFSLCFLWTSHFVLPFLQADRWQEDHPLNFCTCKSSLLHSHLCAHAGMDRKS